MPMRPKPELRLCPEQGGLEQRDDDALMQLSAAGVEPAFEALIRRHQAALRGFCARLCGSATGDEVAQEVLVTVWKLRASYQPNGGFRALLFTIARRRCLNARRDAGRAWSELDVDERDLRADQLDALLVRERQRLLDTRLAQLSLAQREAILLHFAADLDYAAIAEVTRRPAATIRTRVFLGLQKLRALAKKRGELP
jgi:RNA polymerase sigma-70 factor (ECF subfamily)